MNEVDRRHLQVLSVLRQVAGTLAALFACFPIIHLVVGIALVTGALGHGSDEPAVRFLGVFTIFVLSRPARRQAFVAGHASYL